MPASEQAKLIVKLLGFNQSFLTKRIVKKFQNKPPTVTRFLTKTLLKFESFLLLNSIAEIWPTHRQTQSLLFRYIHLDY